MKKLLYNHDHESHSVNIRADSTFGNSLCKIKAIYPIGTCSQSVEGKEMTFSRINRINFQMSYLFVKFKSQISLERIRIFSIQCYLRPFHFPHCLWPISIFSNRFIFPLLFPIFFFESIKTKQGTSVISPIIPLVAVVLSAFIISQKSVDHVFETYPSLYIITFGMVSAKVTNKLVVSNVIHPKNGRLK